jgi:hypothetical protein
MDAALGVRHFTVPFSMEFVSFDRSFTEFLVGKKEGTSRA